MVHGTSCKNARSDHKILLHNIFPGAGIEQTSSSTGATRLLPPLALRPPGAGPCDAGRPHESARHAGASRLL